MNISITTYSKTLIAFAAVIVLAAPLAFAHAEGDSFDGMWDAPYSYSPDTYGTYSPDTYTTYSPDTYGTYSPDTYDTYGSGYTGSGYSTGSYGGSGYMSGGSLSGGYLRGTSGYSSSVSSVYAPTYAPIYAPTDTCTAVNSCNSYSDNHSIFNAPTTVTVSQPAAPVYYPQPVVYSNPAPTYYPPACNTCSCNSTYCPHVAYNYPATPYVALSAVPYTGLELGFWGTIAYWGFLILWCLVAAYLVVVKKVQNRILRSLNSFLFGDAVTSHEVAVAAPAVHTYSAPVAIPQVDAIDDFILSQVNRPRRA